MINLFFSELWSVLTALSLWLFIGAFIAGLLKIWLPENFIINHMGKPSLGSIVKTTLLGIPLPLCSCGVLPTTIALKKSGADNGATVSFLISTPQTGVDSILVTTSFLGWPLALFKVLAALVTGLIGGLAVQLSEINKNKSLASNPATEPTCDDENKCNTILYKKSKWDIFFNYSIKELIGGIYLYLLIGIAIAALVSILFPNQLLADYPVLKGPLGMLIMLIIATPIYICTTGSVPIAASLIQAGLPIGSALVFLMAGPATNAATLGAVYKSFGKKITFIYLATVVFGSIVFALIFQNWLGAEQTILNFHYEHHPLWRQWLNGAAALGLIALIVYWGAKDSLSFFKGLFRNKKHSQLSAILKVTGMTCNNCVSHVKRAIENIKDVNKVEISLNTGLVRLYGENFNLDKIRTAIIKAGYQSEVIK